MPVGGRFILEYEEASSSLHLGHGSRGQPFGLGHSLSPLALGTFGAGPFPVVRAILGIVPLIHLVSTALSPSHSCPSGDSACSGTWPGGSSNSVSPSVCVCDIPQIKPVFPIPFSLPLPPPPPYQNIRVNRGSIVYRAALFASSPLSHRSARGLCGIPSRCLWRVGFECCPQTSTWRTWVMPDQRGSV